MARNELKFLLIGLAVGAVILPSLIWTVGNAFLGPYANGSVFAFWSDFIFQLISGSISAFVILLAPYTLFTLARLLLNYARARP